MLVKFESFLWGMCSYTVIVFWNEKYSACYYCLNQTPCMKQNMSILRWITYLKNVTTLLTKFFTSLLRIFRKKCFSILYLKRCKTPRGHKVVYVNHLPSQAEWSFLDFKLWPLSVLQIKGWKVFLFLIGSKIFGTRVVTF